MTASHPYDPLLEGSGRDLSMPDLARWLPDAIRWRWPRFEVTYGGFESDWTGGVRTPGRRLGYLVANLLDLSRIEAGELKVHADAFEVDDLLGPALERFRAGLADRPLELDLVPAPVRVDPVLMDEAFSNLIENAIKHTPTGTRIRITAAALDEAVVRVTIEDSGPGVPAEALPRIFERFFQAPGAGRRRSGSGIRATRPRRGNHDRTARDHERRRHRRQGRPGSLAADDPSRSAAGARASLCFSTISAAPATARPPCWSRPSGSTRSCHDSRMNRNPQAGRWRD